MMKSTRPERGIATPEECFGRIVENRSESWFNSCVHDCSGSILLDTGRRHSDTAPSPCHDIPH